MNATNELATVSAEELTQVEGGFNITDIPGAIVQLGAAIVTGIGHALAVAGVIQDVRTASGQPFP